MTNSVAIATCHEVCDLDDEGRLLLQELRSRGIITDPVVWDSEADWTSYDIVLIRSTWDYHEATVDFMRWARLVGHRLLNSLPIVEWNLSKRYLLDLKSWGLPVVATTYLQPGGDFTLPSGEFVVKPAISAGSKEAARYDQTRVADARGHIIRLHDRGLAALVQPYYSSVESAAETAMIFIDGVFVHAMRKGPLLELGQELEAGLFRVEDMSPRLPSSDELEVARSAVAEVHGRIGSTVYARVDLIQGDDGMPEILELELIEPSLFLDYSVQAASLLADAVALRLRQ